VKYQIDSAASRVRVTARSSVHDTETVWNRLSGEVDADAAELASAGATVALTVDMTAFDAGDFLKNRKIKKDLALDRNPSASFRLVRLDGVADQGGGAFTATAVASSRGMARTSRSARPVAVASTAAASRRVALSSST
jgi:hypothetical protein